MSGANFVKGVVNQTDMKESEQQKVIDTIGEIMCIDKKKQTAVEVATHVRERFDRDTNGSWICVAGHDFSW